jgi:hypothetical protein
VAARNSWAVSAVGGILTTEDVRLHIGALLTPGSTNVKAKTGLRPGASTAAGSPGLVAAQGTPDKTVKVNSFQAFLQTGRGAGSYIQCLDVNTNIDLLTATPADPSQQRNDLIIAQQNDTTYSDANNTWTVKQVVGTPSGTPTDPTVTGSTDYFVLARVRVTAGATTITSGMIDDLRPSWTVSLGGVLPVKDAAGRATLTPYDGMTIWRIDRVWLEVYSIAYAGWIVQGIGVTASNADAVAAVTTPYIGQKIYRSDVRDYRVWDGGAWRHERIIGGVRVTASGIITSSGATNTEVNIPKMAMSGRRVVSGTVYVIHANIQGQSSVNADDYQIRIREDTALSGNVIADWRWIDGSAAVVNDQRCWLAYWKCTATSTNKSFFVSVTRLLGTGQLDVQGDSKTVWWIEEHTADTTGVWVDVP